MRIIVDGNLIPAIFNSEMTNEKRKNKPGAGRPKLPNAKRNKITVRFSDEELETVRVRLGGFTGTLIRDVVLKG